jgi:hypothetical protein
MLKEKTWDNPDKMHIETGHKTFDRQTICISAGASISPTHFAMRVRSKNDLMNPMNDICEVGYLQNYDCNVSHRNSHIAAKDYAKELADKHDGVLLHQFFHWNGQKKIVNGYVITKDKVALLKLYVGERAKTEAIINEVTKYIGEENDSTREIYLVKHAAWLAS